jgi:hypothetical protein
MPIIWMTHHVMRFDDAPHPSLLQIPTRAGRLETVRLDSDVVTPQELARFLGVILDRKLRFAAHKKL